MSKEETLKEWEEITSCDMLRTAKELVSHLSGEGVVSKAEMWRSIGNIHEACREVCRDEEKKAIEKENVRGF